MSTGFIFDVDGTLWDSVTRLNGNMDERRRTISKRYGNKGGTKSWRNSIRNDNE